MPFVPMVGRVDDESFLDTVGGSGQVALFPTGAGPVFFEDFFMPFIRLCLVTGLVAQPTASVGVMVGTLIWEGGTSSPAKLIRDGILNSGHQFLLELVVAESLGFGDVEFDLKLVLEVQDFFIESGDFSIVGLQLRILNILIMSILGPLVLFSLQGIQFCLQVTEDLFSLLKVGEEICILVVKLFFIGTLLVGLCGEEVFQGFFLILKGFQVLIGLTFFLQQHPQL